MPSVLHISTECYPAAKAGGMGDVVGALPIYLPQAGYDAAVVIPKYKNTWFQKNKFKTKKRGQFTLGDETIHYDVQQLNPGILDFPFYCIEIPGKFDREDIYLGPNGHGYPDEVARNIAFQTAVMEWLVYSTEVFDVLHCHDHMTGLIPFFMQHVPAYKKYKKTPSIFTIHNGQYRGIFSWNYEPLLPDCDPEHKGILDWDGHINPQATAIKCAWGVNTVSPTYMEELRADADTMTPLFESEKDKSTGIINGIDNALWDPTTDKYLHYHLKDDESWPTFKSKQKKSLLKKYNLLSKRPLISYIGRLANQKGADFLLQALHSCILKSMPFTFMLLGTGDKELEEKCRALSKRYPRYISTILEYDEGLARKIYAGSDFLIMPSRFEPCGLNQMYAMRYGTIPIVRSVGGLKDTVPDIIDEGNGITFNNMSLAEIQNSIRRAIDLYEDQKGFITLRKKIVQLDFSWKASAETYSKLYDKHLN